MKNKFIVGFTFVYEGKLRTIEDVPHCRKCGEWLTERQVFSWHCNDNEGFVVLHEKCPVKLPKCPGTKDGVHEFRLSGSCFYCCAPSKIYPECE